MNSVPLVSIILPVRNESAYIESNLGAIFVQDYPADCIELLIADGMSTDRTREIITTMAKKYATVSLRILDSPEKIVPTGKYQSVMILITSPNE